jgi:XTP/dITP diphosphohydrolase
MKHDFEPLMVTFASNNTHKLIELESFVKTYQLPIQLCLPENLMDVEENGDTFAENARNKLESANPAPESQWILAEDSGFVIPALAGAYGLKAFPGVRAKRWMDLAVRRELLKFVDSKPPVSDAERNVGILVLMEGKVNRQASYVCAMALKNTKTQALYEVQAEMPVEIIGDNQPKGSQGFGYDPIVYPLEFQENPRRTVAELSVAEKNRISHRGKALKALLELLSVKRVEG